MDVTMCRRRAVSPTADHRQGEPERGQVFVYWDNPKIFIGAVRKRPNGKAWKRSTGFESASAR